MATFRIMREGVGHEMRFGCVMLACTYIYNPHHVHFCGFFAGFAISKIFASSKKT